MQSENIIYRINSIYESLSPSEKKVGKFIKTNVNDVIYMTISELGSLVGVGDATILRFCKKLNFKTYQEFKIYLALNLNKEEVNNHDGEESLAEKIINYDINILKETLQLLDNETILKTANEIINANNIFICGVGSSFITCKDLNHKLLRIGINSIVNEDYHTQLMALSLSTQKDVIVGISFSGSSKDTIKLLETGKKNKSKIISITHHIKSPITNISEYTLIHGAQEDPLHGGNISSRIAQLAIIDILYQTIFSLIKKDADKARQKTASVISELMS